MDLQSLQVFFYIFKIKYRRKCSVLTTLSCCIIIIVLFNLSVTVEAKCEVNCMNNGKCINNGTSCECLDGWQGNECQFCGGKVR
jgi:hypothetical protein